MSKGWSGEQVVVALSQIQIHGQVIGRVEGEVLKEMRWRGIVVEDV